MPQAFLFSIFYKLLKKYYGFVIVIYKFVNPIVSVL